METGVSLQSTQGPLGPSWTQHVAEGASCVSTRSWLPPYKTKMPANALHPVRKKSVLLRNRQGGALNSDAKGPAKRQKSIGLLAEKIPGEEQDVRGALGQSPHKVGIPFRAERDVDPHLPSLFH